MSEELFRKVLVLSGKARKTYFLCKCIVPLEPPSQDPSNSALQNVETETFCNIKCATFKGMLRHLDKKHNIFLPASIVCQSCQVVLKSLCQSIAHFKQHMEKAIEAFNCGDEEFHCDSCNTNKNLIKMIRSGITYDL